MGICSLAFTRLLKPSSIVVELDTSSFPLQFVMQRRTFLQNTSLATLGMAVRSIAAPVPRIAYGGISIESSTYGHIRSHIEDFTILRGTALDDSARFAYLKKRYDIPFMPTLVATAVPGGPIARPDYDKMKAEFLDRLHALLPLDGLYLPMHGAMFVEGMQDAEGDWYTAARKVVGEQCLMSASYDLHGNISKKIIDTLDMLSAFRTAPHIDREETQIRACDMLVKCLREKIRPTLLWATIPVLMPGERSSTEWDPGKRLWAQLPELNQTPGILDVSMLVGYVWADEPRSAASVVVTGTNRAAEERVAKNLAQQYWDARREFQFGTTVCSLDECLKKAMASPTHPVVLADSGDNPTGGGNGDQATVLEALIKANAQGVVFGGIADRPATEACYQAGVGATIPMSIGATLDRYASKPVKVRATVKALLENAPPEKREAAVQINGITLILSAYRRPYHEIVDFTKLGVDPKAAKILVVKSGYLEPQIKAIANPNLMALTDGSINQDIVHLPKNQYRPPTFPFVDDLTYTPQVYLSARNK
jgi:microcystin degradation protein MlrC